MKQKLTHSISGKGLHDISTIARGDNTESWATAYKGTTTVIRRSEKTCPKNPFCGKNTTGNLGRNHGPNSMQLAAHPMRLYSSSEINFKTNNKTPEGVYAG